MTRPALSFRPFVRPFTLAAACVGALWLSGCGTPAGRVPGQLSEASATPASGASAASPPASQAGNARDYRRDAARHVYALNRSQIYPGQLPALLHAVGTLQVHLDAQGRVRSLHWLRAPGHAPDAIAGIERTVLAAAPYPVAARLGEVVWTDTWLWDKSGRFQLDTLSEGQLQH